MDGVDRERHAGWVCHTHTHTRAPFVSEGRPHPLLHSILLLTIIMLRSAPHTRSPPSFFVSPFKSTGSVNLLDVSAFDPSNINTKKIKISTDRSGNFYHHAEWLDVNGDGRLDVLAARAFKSMNPFSHPESDLVWLEQPPEGAAGKWIEHQITGKAGPGVAFTVVDLDGDGKVEVVAAQFFVKQQLSVWWCEEQFWSECVNGTGVKSAVIDDAEKAPYFNVAFVDLNNDGKKDLLATTNEANGKGAVFGFELPVGGFDKPGAKWAKHRIATGYKPTKVRGVWSRERERVCVCVCVCVCVPYEWYHTRVHDTARSRCSG